LYIEGSPIVRDPAADCVSVLPRRPSWNQHGLYGGRRPAASESFRLRDTNCNDGFEFLNVTPPHFLKFDRENHRHSDIIAQIVKPAPDKGAGLLLLEIRQTNGASHVRTPHFFAASSPAGRGPNQYHPRATIHAGARTR
jgi:hypothetical protein